MYDSFSFNVSQDLSFDFNGVLQKFLMNGRFIAEHIRNGKVIGKYNFPNGITNVGKNYILDAGFNSGTQVSQSSWCLGIIDNGSFSALAATDTMASHTGWIEFTNYSESTRVAWGSGSASGQQVTNASAVTFDITGSGTLNGIFVTSNNTKSGTTGTLWTTASFPTTIPVTSGDQLKITYAIAC